MPTAPDYVAARDRSIAPRRFLADPMPPSNFGSLDPHDSLMARIERLWPRGKVQVIEFRFGHDHPHDASITEWGKPVPLTRFAAAEALRIALHGRRRLGLRIERSKTGYDVAGALNPGWSYS